MKFLIIGLLIGLWVGGKLKDISWRDNSKRIQRVLSKGKFYKVVALDNRESWDNLDAHRPQRPYSEESFDFQRWWVDMEKRAFTEAEEERRKSK